MDPQMEPLQCLPQQPLTSPKGERLVLCNADAGYPHSIDSSSSGRGQWYGNIARTDIRTFLWESSEGAIPGIWNWPAVVLKPEEYSLRVGGMSVKRLRRQLEEYWGRGGIPGDGVENDYQDMWVHAQEKRSIHRSYDMAWDSALSKNPRLLHSTIFSRWLGRECALWLGYFIAENHTLGVVHAWFAAFLGVTQESLSEIATFFIDAAMVHDPNNEKFRAAISQLKFRMSFDVCMEHYDKVVDGIPALPLPNTILTNEQGIPVINNSKHEMFPRRIWDICANTVIPATWFCGPPCPLTGSTIVSIVGVKPVSHAWVANEDLCFVLTEANQQLWPIPLPRGVGLEDVRGEMIRLGVRYAWLDVVCLRQQAKPTLAINLAIPITEVVERREKRRLEEWEVDVPTIGAIYSCRGGGN